TPAEWSLRWIWNRPEVITVLSGLNEEAHIEENLRIAAEATPQSLTEQDLSLIARAEKKYRELMRVGCTGCRYCMPCPAGVAIPECFDACNALYLWGNKNEAFFRYLLTVGRPLGEKEPGFASRCIDCGQCEEQCPQKLPIRKDLKAVAEQFDGLKLKLMLRFIKLVMFLKRRKNLRKGAATP
ncbi:MAG: aldo/keto reductase, partial [Deltaproteobacteria bacterium]|nr:aldo/keto reductase [Deltaproteobacteria bacterium]